MYADPEPGEAAEPDEAAGEVLEGGHLGPDLIFIFFIFYILYFIFSKIIISLHFERSA